MIKRVVQGSQAYRSKRLRKGMTLVRIGEEGRVTIARRKGYQDAAK